MLERWNRRPGHYALLLLVSAGLCFPWLGASSLWDWDEGLNATAAYEMLESGDWVKPTFNAQLRSAKPALLYWLQVASYRCFGVNEGAARVPSALASILSVLILYEFARRIFTPGTALLAGLILATSPAFCAAGRFANPDALLHLFTLLTFTLFWAGQHLPQRRWLLWIGLSMGGAVLAKGPVGFLLPGSVIFLYLLWARKLSLLWHKHLGWGLLLFLLVVLPWYILVAAETKGEFWRSFFLKHNVGRFVAPMEGHRGTSFYYVLVLTVGLGTWSIYLLPALLTAWRRPPQVGDATLAAQADAQPVASRIGWQHFCACWMAMFLLFFTLASTKLPNYILPVYPAFALVLAWFLYRWQAGEIPLPRWLSWTGIATLALVGVTFGLAAILLSGTWQTALLPQTYPEVKPLAFIGLIPLAGALWAGWFLQKRRVLDLLRVFALTAVLFVGSLGAWGGQALNEHKAPKTLAAVIEATRTEQEIRIGCYRYWQPSFVFYCRQEIKECANDQQVQEFLRSPYESYLVLPIQNWEQLAASVQQPCTVVTREYDLYKRGDVVLLRNR